MNELPVVDGKKWVQSHPERFFRGGIVNAVELAGHIMCDVVHQGLECRVSRSGKWWVVSSDENWMSIPGVSLDQLFSRVFPATEQGPNSMRAEVIVAAFASGIAVYSDASWSVVSGEIDESLKNHLTECAQGTFVAFSCA